MAVPVDYVEKPTLGEEDVCVGIYVLHESEGGYYESLRQDIVLNII